jgi:type II secretion system protein N
MRLPAIRIPRLSFEWLGALGGRTTWLYIGYTAVLFAVCLFITFPHELLIRRVLTGVNRGPVGIEFTSARFAWWDGYDLIGMRFGPIADDSQPPYLECSHMFVRPALGPLIHGNPYDLLLRAELYGGAARGEISLTGNNLAGYIHFSDLSLNRYRTLTSLLDEGQLNGRLSGDLTFQAVNGKFNAGTAGGELRLEGGGLAAAKVNGFTVPDIRFRESKLKFAVKDGRVEIQEFQATGDVNVQASGNITLHEPIQDSVLNFRGTVEQSLATPDAIKTLVALIPRPAGAKPDTPITLTGTLARPRLR